MKFFRITRTVVSAALAASLLLPSAFALYPAQVKADALYFRKTPGGEIIATLPHNTTVAVLDNSSSWFKITYNGKEGYVSGEYLTATTGTASTEVSLGAGRIVCDTSVNLRERPNTSSKILASMKNGASVTASGISEGWYKVDYNGQAGFVHPDYVVFSAAVDSEAPSTVTPTVNAVSYTGDNAQRAQVLSYAAQFLGTPYVYGGSTPSGFDCSGFTSYVYKNTVGSIPRVAQSQFDATTRIARDELQPGDLVFFGSSASSISHVGIYVGDDQFIHSPHTGDVVKYESLTGTYNTRFQGGGRIIFE